MGRFALVVLVLGAPAAASADTFKLFGEAHAGGMYGKGTDGAVADTGGAFFAKSPHGMYGFEIGAELLLFDAWIQHHQYTDGSRITTWTQFGLGIHHTIDTGDAAQIKARTGPFFELGAGL